MCEVTHFRIAFKATDEDGLTATFPLYHIKNIKYLAEDIQNSIQTINYVEFYFNVHGSNASITYSVIITDDSYVFAPCYNYAMTDEIKNKYLDEILNTLHTTITNFSSEIKNLFLDHIDITQEIICKWEH